MKKTYEGKSVIVDYNGCLYLAKNRWYSDQYLGSGHTQDEAIKDMEKTILEKHLQPRSYMFD